MKFILLSDLHLLWDKPVARLDNTCETVLRKFEYVIEKSEEWKAPILQAGDFFDRPRSWYLLPEVVKLLRKHNVVVYAVFGSHDTYMYSEETRHATNLGILERMGLVRILGEEPVYYDLKGLGMHHLWGANPGGQVPVPFERGYNILVIHAPIAKEALWPGHDYMDAGRFLRDHRGFDIILCGDIHRFFCIEDGGRFIVNTGPMLRRRATKYNFTHKPGFFVWDSTEESLDWQEIPHEPAEKVLSRDHIERFEEVDQMLDGFVKSIGDDFESDVDFIANLYSFFKKHKIEKRVIDEISEVVEERK